MNFKSSVLTLFAFLTLVFNPASQAQEAIPTDTMPPWIVLVLKLVSATHVQPTTGIVLSDSGLVLIPSDFASDGDEILVLDGGVDIVRYGRPAKIQQLMTADGVALIQVDGLKRTPATLASDTLLQGDRISLLGYPPAELIAQGTPRIHHPAKIERTGSTAKPQIQSDTALPNVTGAILDQCNNLLGLHAASGVQNMSPDSASKISWSDVLQRAAATAGLKLELIQCSTTPEIVDPEESTEEPIPLGEDEAKDALEDKVEPEPAKEEPVVDELAEEPEEAIEEAVETPEDGEIQPAQDEPVNEEMAEPLEESPEILPPLETTAVPDNKQEETSSNELWMVFLGIAAILLAALLWFLRQRKNSGKEEPVKTESGPPPAAVFPDPPTAQLPQSEPPVSRLPQLLISGESGDGKPFEISTSIDEFPFKAEVGRSGVDINLDFPSISRRHARLEVDRHELTLTDLDSTNGSSINGIPCLEGETMYVEPNDVVLLGDVELSIRKSGPAPDTA
jgi:LPXTG-motif cell wall-anchored protein